MDGQADICMGPIALYLTSRQLGRRHPVSKIDKTKVNTIWLSQSHPRDSSATRTHDKRELITGNSPIKYHQPTKESSATCNANAGNNNNPLFPSKSNHRLHPRKPTTTPFSDYPWVSSPTYIHSQRPQIHPRPHTYAHNILSLSPIPSHINTHMNVYQHTIHDPHHVT